jgi:hypothetical protein
VAYQPSNPLAVLYVRFATRDLLDMLSIAYNQLEVLLEHSIYRLSVDACALHTHMRDALLF